MGLNCPTEGGKMRLTSNTSIFRKYLPFIFIFVSILFLSSKSAIAATEEKSIYIVQYDIHKEIFRSLHIFSFNGNYFKTMKHLEAPDLSWIKDETIEKSRVRKDGYFYGIKVHNKKNNKIEFIERPLINDDKFAKWAIEQLKQVMYNQSVCSESKYKSVYINNIEIEGKSLEIDIVRDTLDVNILLYNNRKYTAARGVCNSSGVSNKVREVFIIWDENKNQMLERYLKRNLISQEGHDFSSLIGLYDFNQDGIPEWIIQRGNDIVNFITIWENNEGKLTQIAESEEYIDINRGE